MRSRRVVTAVVTVLAAVAVQPSAFARADSGPSAGDNQYTDPLATPTTTTASTTTSTVATTTSTNATPTPATLAASGTSTSTSGTASGATSTAANSPTATIASTTTTASGTLPHTGYDAWLAIALGAGMAGAGIGLRRRAGTQ